MNIQISYQTTHYPPPYCFAVVFYLDIEKNFVKTGFELTYLDRDTLTKEEIEAEGYTPNDDYSWFGELKGNWAAVIQELAKKVEISQEPGELEHYIYVETCGKSGFPNDTGKWEQIVQELIQAVHETSGKEHPLTVSVIRDSQETLISWFFALRSAEMRGKELKWETALDLMRFIFSVDYDDMSPVKKTQSGFIYRPGLRSIFCHKG